MDNKDVVINELKLCAYYYEKKLIKRHMLIKLCADMYENKLIELMGSDDFTTFAADCCAKMLTVEAHNYIYGITEVMPKL